MFNLYVINTNDLKNHLMYSFQDLLKGFVLYKEEAEKLGFNIQYVEDINSTQLVSQGNKVDGIFSVWGNGIDLCNENFNQRKFKTATFLDDHHWWSVEGLDLRLKFFDKTDIIFTPYYNSFVKYEVYKKFLNKVFSLYWWAPDYCFSLDKEWKNRKESILLSGANDVDIYPLRHKIKYSGMLLITILPHCGYGDGEGFLHECHGKKYLEYISDFKGMIATSLAPMPVNEGAFIHNLNYTINKNFESLGCGCLSFLETTPDFDDIGLIAYKNYIPITCENFEDQFNKYLQSNKAEEIAMLGRSLAKNKHSTKNRIIRILEVLKQSWI